MGIPDITMHREAMGTPDITMHREAMGIPDIIMHKEISGIPDIMHKEIIRIQGQQHRNEHREQQLQLLL